MKPGSHACASATPWCARTRLPPRNMASHLRQSAVSSHTSIEHNPLKLPWIAQLLRGRRRRRSGDSLHDLGGIALRCSERDVSLRDDSTAAAASIHDDHAPNLV